MRGFQKSRLALLGLLLSFVGSVCAQQIELNDGEAVSFSVGAGTGNAPTVNTQFFIDVPEGISNLNVELTDASGRRDIDVVARPDNPFIFTGDVNNLFNAQAAYVSISLFGDESVNIQDFANPSVAGRRWYFALVGFGNSDGSASGQTQATLTATLSTEPPPTGQFVIEFTETTPEDADCVAGEWDDQRRRAMERAAELLGEQFTSRIPIRIRACWIDFRDEDDEPDTGVLASAGATNNFINTRGVPQREVIYGLPQVLRFAGTRDCQLFGGDDCDEPTIQIRFNRNVDDSGSGFYYGFAPGNVGQIDFIQVAMHEITHGLGFASFYLEDGTSGASFGDGVFRPDAYSLLLGTEIDGEVRPIVDLTDAERQAAFLSRTNLLWLGEEANLSGFNDRPAIGDDTRRVQLFAPIPYNGGSSVSHINSTYCTLMNAFIRTCDGEAIRTFGLAKPILNAIGWNESGEDPYIGLQFDRERNGHGYELVLAGQNGGENIYVQTLYTYDDQGNPEWFQAVGSINGGTFEADRNSDDNGLLSFLYDANDTPPQTAQAAPFGQSAISYNVPLKSAACNDGVDRTGAGNPASFLWEIGNQTGQWCVEQLVAENNIPAQDFGGLWCAEGCENPANDTGWGMTIENFETGSGVGLFVLLYVYAADGSPVWFFGQPDGFVPGQPITFDLIQRNAFGRTQNAVAFADQVAGSMTLTLDNPPGAPFVAAGNSVSIDVTYQGAEGGSWQRDNLSIVRLSLPR